MDGGAVHGHTAVGMEQDEVPAVLLTLPASPQSHCSAISLHGFCHLSTCILVPAGARLIICIHSQPKHSVLRTAGCFRAELATVVTDNK